MKTCLYSAACYWLLQVCHWGTWTLAKISFSSTWLWMLEYFLLCQGNYLPRIQSRKRKFAWYNRGWKKIDLFKYLTFTHHTNTLRHLFVVIMAHYIYWFKHPTRDMCPDSEKPRIKRTQNLKSDTWDQVLINHFLVVWATSWVYWIIVSLFIKGW